MGIVWDTDDDLWNMLSHCFGWGTPWFGCKIWRIHLECSQRSKKDGWETLTSNLRNSDHDKDQEVEKGQGQREGQEEGKGLGGGRWYHHMGRMDLCAERQGAQGWSDPPPPWYICSMTPRKFKTVELVLMNYWWKRIHRDIRAYVDGCSRFQQTKTFPENTEANYSN